MAPWLNLNNTNKVMVFLFPASELCPSTLYEFCIAVRHHQRSHIINCTRIDTHASTHIKRPAAGLQDYIVIGTISSLIFLTLALCFIAHGVKSYTKRRRQQTRDSLQGDNLSHLFLACMDTSLSDMGPATFENKGALTSIEEEEGKIEQAIIQQEPLEGATANSSIT